MRALYLLRNYIFYVLKGERTMAKLRKVLSTDVNEPVWRAVGPLDIRFAGQYVDAYWKGEHVLEIEQSSIDDRPFGFTFAIPAGNGWGRRRNWVSLALEREPISVEEVVDVHGMNHGITIYMGEYPVVSIMEYNATTYVYVAKTPEELRGSGIAFAPLTLHCSYNKDGEKFY